MGILCPGAKNIFSPPPTRNAKLEVKRRKSAEEAKAEHLLLTYYFEII